MNTPPTIAKHPLSHIAKLTVSDKVLRARFAADCKMSSCPGRCCHLGADVDVGQYHRILAHADVIRRHMDTVQLEAGEIWFGEQFADPDFPSGQAVSTRVHNDACIFLNGQNRCVLHLAEQQSGADLKPFFCRAYPLCIEDGVLTIDENVCSGETQCCGSLEHGSLTIFDLCAFELEYVLGEEGERELRELANAAQA